MQQVKAARTGGADDARARWLHAIHMSKFAVVHVLMSLGVSEQGLRRFFATTWPVMFAFDLLDQILFVPF